MDGKRPSVDPAQMIYNRLEEDRFEKNKNYRAPARRFKASEAADEPRKIWHRLSGYIPDPSPSGLQLFAYAGNYFHELTQQLLIYSGTPLKNIKVNDDGTVDEDRFRTKEYVHSGERFEVGARCDGVFDHEGAESTLEIKTIGHWGLSYIEKTYHKDGLEATIEYIRDRYPGYMYQPTLTADIYGTKFASLLLVGRDRCQIGVYDKKKKSYICLTWEVRKEDLDKVLNKLAYVHRHVVSGVAPMPMALQGSKSCNQCEFYKHCHGKGIG